jgi:rhodanese-related sulfurtransferase
MSSTADFIVEQARQRILRVQAHQLDEFIGSWGLLIDIRPAAQRYEEGSLPGAIVVERNVLEWRLDATGSHRLKEVTDYEQPIVIFCSEGYASSLAAASVVDLGFHHVADLIGGYKAWEAWITSAGFPTLRVVN